jgi:hypothetical protein
MLYFLRAAELRFHKSTKEQILLVASLRDSSASVLIKGSDADTHSPEWRLSSWRREHIGMMPTYKYLV